MNLLQQITVAAKNKTFTLGQLTEAYNNGLPQLVQPKKNLTASSLMSSIGIAFLFAGIGYIFSGNWNNYSSSIKIMLTLGLGILFTILSTLLNYIYKTKIVTKVLIPISFSWLCFGVLYTIYDYNTDIDSKKLMMIGSLFILSTYYFLLFIKQKIGLYFSIFNISFLGFWIATIDFIASKTGNVGENKYVWLSLAIVSVLDLVIHTYYRSELKKIIKGINLIGFYGSLTFSLGYFLNLCRYNIMVDNFENIKTAFDSRNFIIESSLSLFFTAMYYLSVKFQSTILLIINSIAIYIWLSYMYSQYFTNTNFGVSLIVFGTLLIMISYLTMRFGKKYIA